MDRYLSIRSIWSTDLPQGDMPRNPASFQGQFFADIGPIDSEQSETFKFLVMTFNELQKINSTVWGSGILLMPEFSWAELEPQLLFRLSHIRSANWEQSIDEIKRLLQLQDEYWNSQRLPPNE